MTERDDRLAEIGKEKKELLSTIRNCNFQLGWLEDRRKKLYRTRFEISCDKEITFVRAPNTKVDILHNEEDIFGKHILIMDVWEDEI